MMADLKNAIQLKSAPKFLEAYNRQDAAGYGIPGEIAVRREALDRLYKLHKLTSFMVLHGPSGSGKTSLINGGHVKQIKIPERGVFYLKREGHFLNSFSRQLEEKLPGRNFGEHISAYIESEETLLKKKQEVDTFNNKIVELESMSESDIKEGAPTVAEIVAQRNEVKSWIKSKSNVKESKAILVEDFNALFNRLKISPLIIFDQFEEIFTEGSKKERARFGIFGRFLLTAGVPVNSIVIIDEDYFGHLDEFIKYIPRIFYNSTRLLDPNREMARSILQNLFEESEAEENSKTIDRLIAQFRLKKIDTSNKTIKQTVHLPFLQIYLKAYQDQFGKAFTPKKISSLGKVDEVLEQYLEDLNGRILKKFGKHDPKGLKQEFPIVKYLKNYVSTMTGQAQKFKIENPEELQNNIWPVDINERLDLALINKYLLEEGILNIRNDGYELAHDSLAIPIRNFNIREDLHKKDFDASFQIWNQKKEQVEEAAATGFNPIEKVKTYLFPKNLLSKGQVASMSTYKDYIIPRDEEHFSEKLRFWKRSRINVKKWNTLGLVVLGLMLLGAFTNIYTLKGRLDAEKEKVAAEMAKVQAEKDRALEQEKGALKGKVYEGTGEAWNAYRNDRTSAFSEIQRSYLNWKGGNPEVTESVEFPTMVSDFQNVFYSDYNEYPFYSKNIKPKGGYITKTKTRMVGDSLFIFALTSRDSLYTYMLDWKDKQAEAVQVDHSIGKVKHFEPFKDENDNLKILTITEDGKIILNSNVLVSQWDTLQRINGKDIGGLSGLEHLEGNKFVVSKDRSLYDFFIHKDLRFGMFYRESVPGEVMQIRKLSDFHHEYVVRYGRSGLYLSGTPGQGDGVVIKESNKTKGNVIPSDKIYALTYDKKKQRLLLGYNRGLVISCNRFAEDANKLDFRHREAISSISIEKDMYLVGSLDKTASIWQNNKLLKTLIGHKDALYNVSFVDGSNFVISSGEDGSIKMWDLSPTHEVEKIIPGRKMVTQVKYDPVKSKYIVAYKSLTADGNKSYQGKVLTYDASLEKFGEIYQDKRYGNGIGYINTFDYNGNSLVMAGNANQVVTTAREDRAKKILFTRITSTIHDIEIGDSTMYIATNKGVLYSPLYSKTGKYDTLSRGHQVNAISFSSAKNMLVVGREDANVILYSNNQEVARITDHSDKVSDVSFSENGHFMASGSWDNRVFIWKMDGDQPQKIFEDKHLNDVRDIEFFKDSLLLAGGLGRTVRLYGKYSDNRFKVLPSLISHNYAITAATFSQPTESGDIHVLSGDLNGHLRHWDIASFEEQIASRTYDKIKMDKLKVDLAIALRGKWKLSSGGADSHPTRLNFKHAPNFSMNGNKDGLFEITGAKEITLTTHGSVLKYQFKFLSPDSLELKNDSATLIFER